MCNRHYCRWRAYGDPEAPLRVQRSRVRWTATDLYEIEAGIEAGWTDETIARRLGCTVRALRLARKRHGLRSRSATLMSARSVADLLGVGCSKTITHWLAAGWLRGRRGSVYGLHRRWLVTEDALLEFLADQAHWHRWQAERITESGLREWALEQRGGVRFLTPAEVADRCFVGVGAVNDWIQSGVLPAVRNGNHLVRESDLVGFVPPGQRSRIGQSQNAWGAEDDRVLCEMRCAGQTYAAIARVLGRSIGSVSNRWHRLEQRRIDTTA